VHAFEPPERFVAGTVGVPGERTFFLQARGGGRLVSVVLEKVQVSLLAEKLEELLAEAHRRFGVTMPEMPAISDDNEPLDLPLDEEFRVGTLGLAWDGDTDTVVIEAIAVGEYQAEEPTEEELAELDRLRVRLTPAATQAFIGRPPAVSSVWSAARPRGTPLPASQRLPPVAPVPGTTRRRITRTFSREDALRLLSEGDLQLEGRLMDASNTTLRAYVTLDGVTGRCVYKPVRGERPLWDFPDGTLAAREVAAFEVSAATGWDVVPPTVLRDGPLGEGACQLWIDEVADEASARVGFVPADALPEGWLTVAAAEDDDGDAYLLAHADDVALSQMAIFDVVINNADRKGGHVLRSKDGAVWGVDHGVCFHVDDKLRTVLWGWVGRPFPQPARATLLRENLDGPLGRRLRDLLAPDEVDATVRRVERLRTTGVFPEPRPGRPAVPWPPI
jgi:uncharacterized repeat protein (TIGR03843 family)